MSDLRFQPVSGRLNRWAGVSQAGSLLIVSPLRSVPQGEWQVGSKSAQLLNRESGQNAAAGACGLFRSHPTRRTQTYFDGSYFMPGNKVPQRVFRIRRRADGRYECRNESQMIARLVWTN